MDNDCFCTVRLGWTRRERVVVEKRNTLKSGPLVGVGRTRYVSKYEKVDEFRGS